MICLQHRIKINLIPEFIVRVYFKIQLEKYDFNPYTKCEHWTECNRKSFRLILPGVALAAACNEHMAIFCSCCIWLVTGECNGFGFSLLLGGSCGSFAVIGPVCGPPVLSSDSMGLGHCSANPVDALNKKQTNIQI